MIFKNLTLLLTVCVFCFSNQAQDRKIIICDKPSNEKAYKKWLEKDALYIITKKEKEDFLNLKTNDEKEKFVENFWLRRDPSPETEENEFREEYYERIAFTNENFASGIQGWRTDRGMIYILYGKPDKIEKGRTIFEEFENILFEKWSYKYLPGEKADTTFTFFDPTETQEFRLEKTKREELIKSIESGLSNCFNCANQTLTHKKEIEIQLTPFGYISLPKGYWAYMDANYGDAWAGFIETLDSKYKIRFSDGLIVSVFDGEDKNIKWRKELKTENYSITYALADDGKTKRILAKIKSANFSTQIQDDSDVDKFLEIISSYQTGRCESCFNSQSTKGIKKVFEKLNKND